MIGKTVLLLGAFLALAYASSIGNSKTNSFWMVEGSCEGRCNKTGTIDGDCQCNIPCVSFGDCCPDYAELCLGGGGPGDDMSCQGRCSQVGTDPDAKCQCNKPCQEYGDCCPDYQDLCGGGTGGPITDAELSALAEELLALDSANNVASLITVNLEGSPLLELAPGALDTPTIKLFQTLLDNYVPAVGTAENVTPAEEAEEAAFLDAVMATPVMQAAQAFLEAKGLPFGRANLEEIWFGLYSRSGSTLGSSGFEHIFLGEIKGGVSGFHNWIFFAREEANGNLNYLKYMDTVDLGSKGMIIEHSFNWLGQSKPVSSMYIGTSPEFELAINTVCWHSRPNAKCRVTLNGSNVGVQTYDLSSNGKKYVASAYPDLSE